MIPKAAAELTGSKDAEHDARCRFSEAVGQGSPSTICSSLDGSRRAQFIEDVITRYESGLPL